MILVENGKDGGICFTIIGYYFFMNFYVLVLSSYALSSLFFFLLATDYTYSTLPTFVTPHTHTHIDTHM